MLLEVCGLSLGIDTSRRVSKDGKLCATVIVLFVRSPLALVASSYLACNEERERRLDVVSTRKIPLGDGQTEVPARVDVE